MSKYKNQKVTKGGETFDSIKEYMRYLHLIQLERIGQISNLQRQVRYELVPPQYDPVPRYSEKTGQRLKDGKKLVEHGVYYVADFVYNLKDGATVVEDVKGYREGSAYAIFSIKRKLMLEKHGIRVQEI
jgi:hypothetical protein